MRRECEEGEREKKKSTCKPKFLTAECGAHVREIINYDHKKKKNQRSMKEVAILTGETPERWRQKRRRLIGCSRDSYPCNRIWLFQSPGCELHHGRGPTNHCLWKLCSPESALRSRSRSSIFRARARALCGCSRRSFLDKLCSVGCHRQRNKFKLFNP